MKEASAYADAHLHRFKEQPAQLYHEDIREENYWYYQYLRMNVQLMRSACFPRNHQQYLFWYHDSLLIRLADIVSLYRQTENRTEEFEEHCVFSMGSVGDDIMCFCSNTWFIASFGPRL